MKTFKEYTRKRTYFISMPEAIVPTVIDSYKSRLRLGKITFRSFCRKMPKYLSDQVTVKFDPLPEPPEQIELFGVANEK